MTLVTLYGSENLKNIARKKKGNGLKMILEYN